MADRPKHLADSTMLDTGQFTVAMVVVPQVSTNDTVTFADFQQIIVLNTCLADFSQIPAWTNNANQITLVTSSLFNVKAVLFIMGRR